MKLYFYGHEMVSQPAYPKVESLIGLSEVTQNIVSVMDRHKLNGLSAPQVGISQQLVVVKLKDGPIVELINPRIHRMYGPESDLPERCISCPPYDNSCKVPRIQVVHVLAASPNDLDTVEEYKFKGVDARVVQHEIDHLEGTFFFDRASIKDKATVLHRYRAWKIQWKRDNAIKEKNMAAGAAVARPRPKQAVPTETPLEAGPLMCAACGSLMLATPVMGPRAVEAVRYICINEERGCRYEVTRKVPVGNATMRGIPVEPAK